MDNARGTVDVKSRIDGSELRSFHMTVFILCGLVALMDGYDSVVIGITGVSIAKSLALDVRTFGPVFSAAQFGFMAGAFIAGPAADRLGRKWVLVAATVLFGAFSMITALAHGFGELVAYRFVTGLGLGGAATCFVSLSSEYAPQRMRGTVVAILWTLVPAGNVVGGIIASILLPKSGWESVYVVGGIVPLVVAALMIFLVPESLTFLVAKGASPDRVSRILSKMDGSAPAQGVTYVSSEEKFSGLAFTHLFNRAYVSTTICIWVAFFSTWLVLITTLAWISPILQQSGLSASEAALAISANSTGGVIGALIISWMIDRTDKYLINVGALVLGAVGLVAFGVASGTFALSMGLSFLMGFFVGGAGSGLTALVATAYPTALRSTAVGWAISVARLGSALGPMIAGVIIGAGGGRVGVFAVLGGFALLAAAATLVLRGVEARLHAGSRPRVMNAV